MINKDTKDLRNVKAEELKEETIKAQSPGPETSEVFEQEANNSKSKESDKPNKLN
ncbi:MAG TPA: hypothetical protein VH500_24235 [Nitrososphaeraceae archaeon]|jgi:hypothetical protein